MRRQRQAQDRRRRRQLWLNLHRYFGLIGGLALSLIGLSGSVLVVDHWLDERLNPEQLLIAEPLAKMARHAVPLSEIVTATQQVFPGTALQISVRAPRHANGLYRVLVYTRSETGRRVIKELSIDPLSGEVVSTRLWGAYLMSWLYNFHHTLLLAEPGEYLVALLGLGLVFVCLSGLYLCWPRNTRAWREQFKVSWGASRLRLWRDLHCSGGGIVSGFCTLLAITGIYLLFPAVLTVPIQWLTDTPRPAAVLTSVDRGGLPFDVDEVVASALRLYPQARFKRLRIPSASNGVYRVRLTTTGDPCVSAGCSLVWLDQYTGRVLLAQSHGEAPFWRRTLNWFFPLHSGEVFGMVGRSVVALSGITVCLLCWSGFYLWWRKHLSFTRSAGAFSKAGR